MDISSIGIIKLRTQFDCFLVNIEVSWSIIAMKWALQFNLLNS